MKSTNPEYVVINPLSVDRQCHSHADVSDVVTKMVECFKFLSPAIRARRVALVYDEVMARRSLAARGGNLTADINSVPDGDIRKLWFLFITKAVLAGGVSSSAAIVSDGRKHVEGEISSGCLVSQKRWLSFGKRAYLERTPLALDVEGKEVKVENAWNLDEFRRLWPSYEASPKHQKDAYTRVGGDTVSPMPLSDDEAQRVLMTSVPNGKDRIAYHRQQFFRFCLTHSGQEIYHGFQINEEDVPAEVLDILKSA